MGRGRVRRALSSLFVVYAAASLVPVVLLGAVLLHGYRHEALQHGLEQGRAQAAVIQEMAIAPSLSGEDLSKGLTSVERSRLQSATDLAIFSGSVAGLRLRSFSGQVTFSDDGSTAGALPSSHPAFRVAAAGRTDVAIVSDARAGPTPVIRVLQPVVANASGRATGVLELYLPYDEVAAETKAQTRHTIWRLAGGLGGLYVVLALISWYTTRRLRRHAAQREHQALHDGLTGLPNREWFRMRAEEALERGRRGELGAVVLVDLDHFKEVNDTLGHAAGDELLRIVGQRLSAALRTDDTVARLGGDEFGLILPRVTDQSSILELLSRLNDELAAVIVLGSVPISIEASFGVAFYPDHSCELETILQRADQAMYQGKRGHASLVVYEPSSAPHVTHALTVQQEVRVALERDELVLHYQPKIELATGRVSGVEALIRWMHPRRGLLAPAEFLPAVEQSGLIAPFTSWVLRRALTDHARWTARGMTWTVAVNVSARNLESKDFPASVAELLAELHFPAEQLHIEVTETALAVDATAASRAVAALADQGIDIAIDDFGIGYTSLLQLRDLTVAEVKIDRAFVMGLQGREQDRAIVRSVINLAHGIGCRVTAEGVESQDVADWLADAGCDYAQGYLFARPQSWLDLIQRLAASSGRLPCRELSASLVDQQPEGSTT